MYNFKSIEAKWQNYCDENKSFKALNDTKKEKFYYLIEFPYPSGAGLHQNRMDIWQSASLSCGRRHAACLLWRPATCWGLIPGTCPLHRGYTVRSLLLVP